jgi:hypothetical protein
MLEEKQDVKPVEPSTTEEGVTDYLDALAPQPEGEEAQPVKEQEQSSEPQEVKETVEADDRGVPWKNVAEEALRKISKLEESLPNLLKGVLEENRTAQPEKPKYTKAQLRAYADEVSDASQKTWAYEEIEKLERQEKEQFMKQMFSEHTKRVQEDTVRAQSRDFVAQNFPDCFVKDDMGRPVGWNESSPLTRRIGEYMQNPDLGKNPQGLMVAAKLAAFDLGISQNRKLQTKVNQATAQLRREQKKQLISGGGAPMAQGDGQKTKIAKLAEQYQKTGDPEIFKALAKARGLIPVE